MNDVANFLLGTAVKEFLKSPKTAGNTVQLRSIIFYVALGTTQYLYTISFPYTQMNLSYPTAGVLVLNATSKVNQIHKRNFGGR